MIAPIAYNSPRVRGRAALMLEDGSMLTDNAYLDDTGPGNVITHEGKRYEIIRNLWWSIYTPSCWIVKPHESQAQAA